MIDFHYWPTPNGKKVTILLEELGVRYRIAPVDIGRGDQFSDAFLAMNPNHRMPVLVDNAPPGGGAPIVRGDEVVGAIGVSGGSVDQDQDIAAAGAAAL